MPRTLMFIAALSVLDTGSVQAHIPSLITKPIFRSIRFVDDTHGWMAGYAGVFHTGDRGQTWRRLSVKLGSVRRFTTRAATEDTGRIVWATRVEALIRTDKGLILVHARSRLWRRIDFSKDALENLYFIAFVDRQNGWGLGFSRKLFRTGDGGATWGLSGRRMVEDMVGMFAVSATEAWAVGGHCTVLHTIDGGQTWEQQRLLGSSSSEIYSIQFISAQEGWICGTDGLVFCTGDGGKRWERQDTPWSNGTVLGSVSFVDRDEGWAVGSRYVKGGKNHDVILHTGDGGRHWAEQATTTEGNLRDIQALPNGRAWAVGEKGAVLRTNDHGKHWAKIKLN